MSTYVNKKEGINALKEISGLFKKNGINYWLGRGLFRHYTLHKKFGDKFSDIDFHVWNGDRPKIHNLLTELEKLRYKIVVDWDYKDNFVREGVTIEIVYLFRKNGKAWHKSKGNYPECDVDCFGDRIIKMFGIDIRVPEEKYLPQVYGKDWEKEIK